MAKAAFSKKKTLFISKLDLNLRGKLIKCYIWSMALYGAETWMLWAADLKYLESFEMWCWRRMEKISWTDHVRNEEVLLRVVNEQRNILHEIRKWKTNWIGHILCRNCLLKQVIEGNLMEAILLCDIIQSYTNIYVNTQLFLLLMQLYFFLGDMFRLIKQPSSGQLTIE